MERQLQLIKSDGIYSAWYDDEAQKVTIQYCRGLAKYRYSNFTPADATEMEGIAQGVGSWFRRKVVVHEDMYPVEKL